MRKSDEQKKLEGTDRNDRTRNAGRIEHLKLERIPILVSYYKEALSERQIKIFKETCKLLIETGIVTKLDIAIIVQYAVALDLNLEASKKLTPKNMVQVFKKTGATNVSGYFTVWKQTTEVLAKVEAKLGLTPYIRERMTSFTESEPKEDEDPFETLAKKLNS